MTQDHDIPGKQAPELFRMALEVLKCGVVLFDRQRKIIFWNNGAETITGYHRHEVVGHTGHANILTQCNEVSCVHCGAACPLTQALHDGKPATTRGYLHHKSGHSIPVRLLMNLIRDDHGSVAAIAANFEEDEIWTSEPSFHENNLAAHGCLDVITGVPNHAFTQSHLRENLAFYGEYHLPFGILRVQVQGLDQLKATHGREAVDVMLHVVAQTMKHTLRPDGFLGRWSDDQLLAIVTDCGPAELQRAAQNVHKIANGSGIQWWDDLLSASVAVGSAMVQAEDTMETFLERAQVPGDPARRTSASASSGGGRSNAAN